MGFKDFLKRSMLAEYSRKIKAAPRQVIFNSSLLLSCVLYATTAIPLTWDQGSASTLPSLAGFEEQFGISSSAGASSTRNFVSLVYLGDAAGAALSFFLNDRIGRLWSFRLYTFVWIIGYMIAIASPGTSALYASRIISGLGIGALSVIGPVAIAELAPAEIRGLLGAWFSVSMGIALMVATFCVYGVGIHLAPSQLQYRTVMFAPCLFMFLWVVASFFLCESPRWLFLTNQEQKATETLVRLRGLPADHPRMQEEIRGVKNSLQSEIQAAEIHDRSPSQIVSISKETFTVPSNLRRVQQVIILYIFPQLSGGNSITNYFIPILEIVGTAGDSNRNLFLNGMYTLSKFFFSLFASFFFIDALGRRNSLFSGISIQMLSDIYLAAYIKVQHDGPVPRSAGEAALAAIFIHSFGYTIGLLTLPYVFGGELWPNRIRSFGAALSQTFHWLFHYAMSFALPSLLERSNDWGAFVFFAAWCFAALLYIYLLVPEIAGLSVEEIEGIFNGPWRVFGNRGHRRQQDGSILEGQEDLSQKLDEKKGDLYPTKSIQKEPVEAVSR